MKMADEHAVGHGLARCVCSGQRLAEASTIMQIAHNDGAWTLKCQHASCNEAKRNKLCLGKVTDEHKTRLWHPSPPDFASFPVTDVDEPVQRLSEQLHQLGLAVAIVKNWAHRADQPPRSNSTYLMLPEEAKAFITMLDSGQQPDMDHLQQFSHVKALVYDISNSSWCAAHYDKTQLTLRLETAMGGASRHMLRRFQAWRTLDLDQEWIVMRPALETCSDPGNAALLTWATLLPSYHDDRITGEFVTILRSAVHNCLQGNMATLRWLIEHGCQQFTSQMPWQPQRAFQRQNKSSAGKVQSKLEILTAGRIPTVVLPNLDAVENYLPITPDILCSLEPIGNSAWAEITPHDPKSTRVISQNVGPVGMMGSLDTVKFIIRQNKPALLLLQDCRIGAQQKEAAGTQLRKTFPQYQIFIRCGTRVQKVAGCKKRYKYAVITMLHKSCGIGQELFGDRQDPDQGRLLTIRVTPNCGKIKDFCVTNVYNYTAKEATLQDRILRELKHRMTHPDVNNLLHLLGGDFNASLLPETRLGATDRILERADNLLSVFMRDGSLCKRWWAGRIREGIWTRRHPAALQAARIDEILILDPQELEADPDDRWRTGNCYSLRTTLTCSAHLDHRTVAADIPSSHIPKPNQCSATKRKRVPDMAAWQTRQDDWRIQVNKVCGSTQAHDNAFAELQRWSNAAVAALPMKTITSGGPGRPAHASKVQQRLTQQIQLLEREILIAADHGQDWASPTASMRKIAAWSKSEEITVIALPDLPLDNGSQPSWIKKLQLGVAQRRKALQLLRREQQSENLEELRQHCRDRMDKPGEKEIKRLLGQTLEKKSVPLRMSKVVSKRHPDKIDGRLTLKKWIDWLAGTLGAQVVPEIRRVWEYERDSGEAVRPCRLAQGEITVELTKTSKSEMRVRVSPLHLITELMDSMPTLSDGEFIRASQSELQKLSHTSDTLCHEECFFATNAMDVHSFCEHCQKDVSGIMPMTKVNPQGQRQLRYLCLHCNVQSDHLLTRPLQPCPISQAVLQANGFDPKARVLTRELSREDFDYWLGKLPARKASGSDLITYEMWQQAPKNMRDALYQVVLAILQGDKMPADWEGALVKLLPKKPGEEAILESTRPICLITTAAKIVTSIWAHRLGLASETRGVMEGAQEGFRRDRSTRRQAVRLLSCINAARERQGKIVIVFLDFENDFNVISHPALFKILRELGLNEQDVEALEQYYASAYMQVTDEDGTASAEIPLHRGLRQGCPLSPILGGMMVNVMIRWLETKGGGIKHGSGIETNNLCFADDTTLLADDMSHMNVLLACMN